MVIKTDYNLAKECVDKITDIVRGILRENSLAPCSYYKVEKVLVGLGSS